jgi:general secretion pathway protein H
MRVFASTPCHSARAQTGTAAAEPVLLACARQRRCLQLSAHGREQRGMTLIEILVVLMIMVLALGAVVLGSGQTSSARLKHSTALLAGAVRLGFSRANTTAKPVRVVFDLEKSTLALEESDGVLLVQSGDKTGTGGAAAANGAEEAAIAENKRILEGPTAPRAKFHSVEEASLHASDNVKKGPRALPAGIRIRSVQTGHDEAPRTEGRAYLYFWPGGQTERAAIQLAVGEQPTDAQIYTIFVAPLTGRVSVKNGAQTLDKLADDKELQEREAPGGF